MTIGILPCAGKAERFGGLPKYLLPCPGGYLLKRHVDAMRETCQQTIIMTHKANYSMVCPNIRLTAVFVANHFETMTQTVLSAKYEIDDRNIDDGITLLGLPDTYLHMEGNPYEGLVNIMENSPNLDLLVGCWQPRPQQWQQSGMVVFEQGDCILAVIDKPDEYPEHSYIWGVMAWRPAFWECLEPDMPHVGYGIMKAVEKGLKVNAVLFKGDYYDAGTPERYFEMIRNVTGYWDHYWEHEIAYNEAIKLLAGGCMLSDCRNDPIVPEMSESYPTYQKRDYQMFCNGSCVGYVTPETERKLRGLTNGG